MRHTWTIVAVCIAACLLKLYLAATTFGTNDILYWKAFAEAISRVGPVRVYSYHFEPGVLYNHPPLVGLLLVAINSLSRLGLPLQFTLRSLCGLADLASSALLYQLLSRTADRRRATIATLLLSASPLVIAVSGFHGNTDPLFVMFVLLSLYLLTCRGAPFLAGSSIAVAVSIKLVPIVLVPALLVYAWKRSGRALAHFILGAVTLGLVIWGPAVVHQLGPITSHVLGYSGVPTRWWGLPQFASWLGYPGLGPWLASHLTLPLVGLCALLSAVLTWRNPSAVLVTAATALTLFLLLSPAIGVQYLLWPLAVAYLVHSGWATIYNVLASLLALKLYTRWSGSILWNTAMSTPPTPVERYLGAVIWVALLILVGVGLAKGTQPCRAANSGNPCPGAAESDDGAGLLRR